LRSIENQAALMRHRVRQQLVGQRTAVLDALRGSGRDRGCDGSGRPTRHRLNRMLGAVENGEIVVPERIRVALAPLAAIAAIDDKLIETVNADKKARRLMTMPGVSPVIRPPSSRRLARPRPLRAAASSPLFSA
jgi:transposase